MDNSDLTFCPLARTEATRLSAINRACPIEADFALVFDRGQDFFRWPDLIYDRYQYLGAFCDGELAGYLMLGLFTGWTGEEFGTCAYLGDARVLPRFRGRHLTQHMMSAMEALVPAEAQLGLSLVKKGNLAAESLAASARSSAYAGHRLGDFHALNIPLLRPSAISSALTVRNARLDDLEAMAELFSRANEGKLFAPSLTEERLRQDLKRLPHLGLSDYWVAERRGHLVGMLAACDMSPFHSTYLLRYSLPAKFLRAAYNLIAMFSPGSVALPAPGGTLRTLTLTRIAIQDQDASVLQAMLVRLIRATLGRGYHLLSVGFSDGDPLIHSTHGFPLVQHFVSSLYCITREPERFKKRGNPPYVDLVMI